MTAWLAELEQLQWLQWLSKGMLSFGWGVFMASLWLRLRDLMDRCVIWEMK